VLGSLIIISKFLPHHQVVSPDTVENKIICYQNDVFLCQQTMIIFASITCNEFQHLRIISQTTLTYCIDDDDDVKI